MEGVSQAGMVVSHRYTGGIDTNRLGPAQILEGASVSPHGIGLEAVERLHFKLPRPNWENPSCRQGRVGAAAHPGTCRDRTLRTVAYGNGGQGAALLRGKAANCSAQ